ncbi:hypothetical protein GCM10009665_32950 [Kitasatospora nipponensis]|uniref:Gram-positive cocci surface proteins LPxTG domain-containing protein n=1 Tax=Kitasatospora nipponensis TaxID=258049 RepID=A0ABP4GVX8_9ACTN
MKLVRSSAVALAALGLCALQLAAGSAASADDLGSLKLTDWLSQSSVLTGGSATFGIWVQAPGGGKVDANVLVTVKPHGSTTASLPTGVSLSFKGSNCTPAVPGTAPAEAAAFMCDVTRAALASPDSSPPMSGWTDGTVTVGASVVDGTQFDLSQTLVPHADLTLAQVEADQKAGKAFQSNSTVYQVLPKGWTPQNTATYQLTDFTAGQSAVQSVKLQSNSQTGWTITTDGTVGGQPWDPTPNPDRLRLPYGLDLVDLAYDNGAQCENVSQEWQHRRGGEGEWLVSCSVQPGETTVKMTFKAAADLKEARVALHSDAYSSAHSAVGTFTVKPAAVTSGSASASASAPAAGPTSATVSAGASTAAGAASRSATPAAPSASASRSATPAAGQQLASTGAGDTVGYGVAGAVVLAAGVGIVVLARRRAARG